jgi:hypothetical protein
MGKNLPFCRNHAQARRMRTYNAEPPPVNREENLYRNRVSEYKNVINNCQLTAPARLARSVGQTR